MDVGGGGNVRVDVLEALCASCQGSGGVNCGSSDVFAHSAL